MADVKIKVTLEGAQFKGETKEMTSAVNEFEGKISTSFDSAIAKVTAFSFAYNQVAEVAGKVGRALEEPIKQFMNFESAMANVASLGVPNIEALNTAVLKTATEIPVELSNLTSGLYDVVSAGVDTANQMYVLEASAMAAKAGLADTSEALGLSSAVIKAYNLDWSETESILDKAFETVKLGQTTFGELSASIGEVTPLAAALDIGIEELFGDFATMTGVVGNASKVATGLKQVLVGLADPTEELSEMIEKNTDLTVEQAVAQEGLAGIMEIIQKETGGSTSQMTKLFGSIEAVNHVLALSGSQYDTFIDKTGSMHNANSAMSEAFAIQADTLESKLQLLDNRWQVIQITMVEAVVPALVAVVDSGADMLEWFSEMDGGLGALQDSFKALQNETAYFEDMSPIINEYETLADKTERSADETKRLKELTEELAKKYPGAVEQVDSFGKALSINTGFLKSWIEIQKDYLKFEFEKQLEKQRDRLEDYLVELGRMPSLLDAVNTELDLTQTALESVEKGSSIWEMHKRSLDNLIDRKKDYNTELKKTNQNVKDIFHNINLFEDLGDYENFEKLRDELDLTAAQFDIMKVQWEEWNLTRLAKIKPPKPDDLDIDKKDKVITIPIKPVIEDEDSFFADLIPPPVPDDWISPFESAAFEESLQHRQNLLELYLETGLVSEEEYFEQQKSLLDEGYEQAVEWFGAKSEMALEYQAQRIALEEEYYVSITELAVGYSKTFSGILGGMMNAFQGVHKTMFEIGRASAAANATVDALSAANAAYKAMAGIPYVGPVLGAVAAAAALAVGYQNVDKIYSTKFEKKKGGGPLDNENRTIEIGDYGDGENRIIIANDDEYLVNAEATRLNRDILDIINFGGARIGLANMKSGGSVSGARASIASEDRWDEVIEAIQDIKIEVRSELDSIQFFRDNYPEYEKDNEESTLL